MRKKCLPVLALLAVLLFACSETQTIETELSPDINEPSPEVISPDNNDALLTPEAVSPYTNTLFVRSSSEPEFIPIPSQPLKFYEMSDNLEDFTVILDGDVFQLPMPLEVFLSYGWRPLNNLSGTLLPNDGTFYGALRDFGGVRLGFYRGEKYITVQLANMSDEVRYLLNSTVVGFYGWHTNVIKELPRGIKTNVSTLEDVLLAFGEPSDPWEGLDTLTYRMGTNSRVRITISNESNRVIRIGAENTVQIDSDKVSNPANVFNEVTQREELYVAPATLGDDLSSFVVELFGDLYRIPAPVSAFLDNGWEFDAKPSDSLPSMRELRGFSLVRGDERLTNIELFNFGDRLLAIERCFVVAIDIGNHGMNSGIRLPGGITIGTHEDKLIELHGDILQKHDTGGSYQFSIHEYIGYSITTINNRIFFDIDTDSGEVSRITFRNVELR